MRTFRHRGVLPKMSGVERTCNSDPTRSPFLRVHNVQRCSIASLQPVLYHLEGDLSFARALVVHNESSTGYVIVSLPESYDCHNGWPDHTAATHPPN